MGRPKKIDELTAEQKREHKEKSKRRNWIEGKFGEGKRKYGLGLVMAKTQKTSESWIAMVIFVMNIARSLWDLFLSLLLWLLRGSIRLAFQVRMKNLMQQYAYFSHTIVWGNWARDFLRKP